MVNPRSSSPALKRTIRASIAAREHAPAIRAIQNLEPVEIVSGATQNPPYMYSVSFFVWIMVAVFAAGFGAGFGLRSYVSYRRRTRTRPKRADVRPVFVPGHVDWADAPLVP